MNRLRLAYQAAHLGQNGVHGVLTLCHAFVYGAAEGGELVGYHGVKGYHRGAAVG